MRLPVLVTLTSLLTSGCLVESHTPEDPVPIEAFCDVFFDALCEPIEACGCGAIAIESCRQEQRELCSGFPSAALRGAVDEGRVIYDPVAASTLAERLRGRGCDAFVSTLDWRVRDLFDLGGTFVGTRGAGDACEVLGFELIGECALGSCASFAEGPICRASVGEGGRCDRTHQCVHLDGELTAESGIDRLVLRCVPDAPGVEEGTCRAWLGEGEVCETDAACWTGRCASERCEAQVMGGDCVTSRECATGLYCADRVCTTAGAPEGASCDVDAACASRVCLGGVCLAAGCGTF